MLITNLNKIFLLLCFSIILCLDLSHCECEESKDQTNYTQNLINYILKQDFENVRLPRRLYGDIYLKKSYIKNLNKIELFEKPVHQVCFNETLAAIQIKLIASNVRFIYDWIYGDDECWGKASVNAQNIYIDIDIQQHKDGEKATMLGLYISDFTDTKFNIIFNAIKRNESMEMIRNQVALATKTALVRDGEITLSMFFSPKVEHFILENKFLIE